MNAYDTAREIIIAAAPWHLNEFRLKPAAANLASDLQRPRRVAQDDAAAVRSSRPVCRFGPGGEYVRNWPE